MGAEARIARLPDRYQGRIKLAKLAPPDSQVMLLELLRPWNPNAIPPGILMGPERHGCGLDGAGLHITQFGRGESTTAGLGPKVVPGIKVSVTCRDSVPKFACQFRAVLVEFGRRPGRGGVNDPPSR